MTSVIYWLSPWELSFSMPLALVLLAFCYVRGHKIPTSRLAACTFWFGWLCYYATAFTQFDYYAEHQFFMHRLQHSVLHHFAPFLIALSRPGTRLWQGLPVPTRRFLGKLLALRLCKSFFAVVNDAWVAVSLFCGLIIFWLIPPVHFLAMLDANLYFVMNWSIALDGLLFWPLVLNNYAGVPAALSQAKRIGILLAVMPPQIAIGLLLFLTPREIYPLYSLCGNAFTLPSLADQQIGGLIVWIHGAMMSILGIIVICIKKDRLIIYPMHSPS